MGGHDLLWKHGPGSGVRGVEVEAEAKVEAGEIGSEYLLKMRKSDKNS